MERSNSHKAKEGETKCSCSPHTLKLAQCVCEMHRFKCKVGGASEYIYKRAEVFCLNSEPLTRFLLKRDVKNIREYHKPDQT